MIKGLIDAEEVIGVVSGNSDSDRGDKNDPPSSLSESESSTRKALSGANLLNGNGDGVRRPATKKQKSFYMVKALDQLTASNKESANKIESAIRSLNDTNSTGDANANRLLEEKVESLNARFQQVEADTKDIKSSLEQMFLLMECVVEINNKHGGYYDHSGNMVPWRNA